MDHLGIRQVFAFDHHFDQWGSSVVPERVEKQAYSVVGQTPFPSSPPETIYHPFMLPHSLCGICQWFGRWQLIHKRIASDMLGKTDAELIHEYRQKKTPQDNQFSQYR
jgi:hypothetical protein